ncbi:FHA domain-containing protein, partial [Myxococcota bacterium]|nr:FHA domain-containing protein [Myxococcota bacterium]
MPVPLKLTVYKGSELVGEHRFDRDIVKIGRLASAHLKLDDTKVSRIHAVIEAASDGQDYSIIDMGSTEGTFVNGEKVSKEKLREGDEIRLGDCRLVVSFEGGDVRSPARELVPPAGDTIPSFSPAAIAAVSQASQSGDLMPRELWTASQSDLSGAVDTQTYAAATLGAQQPVSGIFNAAALASVPSNVTAAQGLPAMPVMPAPAPMLDASVAAAQAVAQAQAAAQAQAQAQAVAQ